MAILKIARMGHPLLRQAAAPVEDPGDPEVRRLVADMLDTMRDAGGAGLAAPQVYAPRRIVVLQVSAGRLAREDGEADEPEEVPLTILVNPKVEPLDGEMVVGWEACLSVPGLAGRVPRHARIRYRGYSLDGAEVAREAAGFHARVVQHECDHLDGILYPQRMSDLSTLAFTSELAAPARAEAVEE